MKRIFELRLFLTAWMLIAAFSRSARADAWSYWGQIFNPNQNFITANAKLATDGTNLYYSTLVDGVWRASFDDHVFSPMPMTGFPLWNSNSNTGFAVWQIATTPQGTLVIGGSPVMIVSNTLSPPPSPNTNSIPVFYWWDETNQLWHPASVTGRNYPYTVSVGNFSTAEDGSLWTCSGFATYAYRSTDGGHSYTAFDINARVPANYFPLPFTSNQFTFGKVFSIVAGPRNEVVIGTETGGFLHTTNNGLNWTSLDPNYTSTNSLDPLGRIGNSLVDGVDKYGNFLCSAFEYNGQFPGFTNWSSVTLIGYNPVDGTYFNAAGGFPPSIGPARILTPPSGTSFCFMNQNNLLQGGVYRSSNGRSWSQFNTNIPALTTPFASNITNAVGPGNCFTTFGNTVFLADGSMTFWSFDSTPPPINNRPPVAYPQNLNLLENTPANLTLIGNDCDGDSLNFTIVTQPQHGSLTGTPPNLTFTPTNNFTGLDFFTFTVDDGLSTSAVALVNFAVNPSTNQPPVVSLTSPADQSIFLAPTNLTITATASDADGIGHVNFYLGGIILASVASPPYTYTLTNLAPGDYAISVRATDKPGLRTWTPPVNITVLPVMPKLGIKQNGGTNAEVSWPAVLDGYFIESADEVNGPWTLSPYPPAYFTNSQIATIPIAGQQFFRLMRPH